MASKIKIPVFVLALLTATSVSMADVLPVADNLNEDRQLAGEQNIPILIEFSLPGCDYCVALEEEVLRPMMLSGEYDGKVIVRKLEASDENTIIDFSGNKISGSDFATKNNVKIYPTLVFFDDKGREVGERLVGLILLDFYFAELDSALNKARKAM